MDAFPGKEPLSAFTQSWQRMIQWYERKNALPGYDITDLLTLTESLAESSYAQSLYASKSLFTLTISTEHDYSKRQQVGRVMVEPCLIKKDNMLVINLFEVSYYAPNALTATRRCQCASSEVKNIVEEMLEHLTVQSNKGG